MRKEARYLAGIRWMVRVFHAVAASRYVTSHRVASRRMASHRVVGGTLLVGIHVSTMYLNSPV